MEEPILFFGNLQQRQKAQEDSLTSKIIDDLRCVTSENIMQKKNTKKLWDWLWWWILVSKWKRNTKNYKKTEIVTVSKAVSRNKWKESNSELSEDEREQTRGNNCVKGSADLQQAIYNAKRDHTKMNLIDNGYEGKCLNWFTVSSASGRSINWKLLNLLNALVNFSMK